MHQRLTLTLREQLSYYRRGGYPVQRLRSGSITTDAEKKQMFKRLQSEFTREKRRQYVFTSLCKVWWILWMLASVVKWEFSWKSVPMINTQKQSFKLNHNPLLVIKLLPLAQVQGNEKVTSSRQQATIPNFRLKQSILSSHNFRRISKCRGLRFRRRQKNISHDWGSDSVHSSKDVPTRKYLTAHANFSLNIINRFPIGSGHQISKLLADCRGQN